jgi:hypothetical protein
MKTRIDNPSILMISGELEEYKAEVESLRDAFMLDTQFIKKITKDVLSVRSSIVVVEKGVSRKIVEKLRESNIVVLYNIKPKVFVRLAEMIGTVSCPCSDLLCAGIPLGRCKQIGRAHV